MILRKCVKKSHDHKKMWPLIFAIDYDVINNKASTIETKKVQWSVMFQA